MELLGLRLAVICLILSGCFMEKVDENTFTYYKFKIGEQTPIDSFKISVKNDTFSIEEPKGKNFQPFVLFEKNNKLHFKSASCNAEEEIKLQVGVELDNKCEAIIPFIGERITVLDKKFFYVENEKYEVFKISNIVGISFLNSSTIFWLKGKGIVLITLQEGEYYELRECDRLIIGLITADKRFSELWPMPPVPPAPTFEENKHQ